MPARRRLIKGGRNFPSILSLEVLIVAENCVWIWGKNVDIGGVLWIGRGFGGGVRIGWVDEVVQWLMSATLKLKFGS